MVAPRTSFDNVNIYGTQHWEFVVDEQFSGYSSFRFPSDIASHGIHLQLTNWSFSSP